MCACAPSLPPRTAVLPEGTVSPYLGAVEQPYWTPSPAVIREADRALPAYLDELSGSSADEPFTRTSARDVRESLGRYRKQVYGVTHEGRRVLRLNAFCTKPRDWKTREVIVPAGGACYFVAWYDPEARRYVRFRPNGRS